MTELAVSGEPGSTMGGSSGGIVVGFVTTVARDRQTEVLVFLLVTMAGFALEGHMRSGEHEACAGMPLRHIGYQP